jgi:polysaccharide pyruvyl transferase WcaK-like protein
MNILHVASFTGNIGDNASHRGFARLLDGFFDGYTVTRLEIRKFYQNYTHPDKHRFDADFVVYANGFDLLVIGGGGFLDYWVPNSASGTTIDMEPALLGKLTVPTLITSVGCAPHKAIPEGNIAKFRAFLDAALANPKLRIAVRNDGSVDAIRRDIGERYLSAIPEVLDHGFFYDTSVKPDILPRGDYVAVNITDDQIRMNSTARGIIDHDRYYGELAASCRYIAQELELPLVFVPHIYSDLNAISQLLARLDDYTIREKISIAPCIQGDDSADWLFGIYKHSRLVMGTRLHANICSLAMGKTAIGLVALDRVKYVYEYFGLTENYVLLDGAYSEALCGKVATAQATGAARTALEEKRNTSRNVYRQWFDELGI